MSIVVTPDFRLKFREWRNLAKKQLLKDGAELVRQQTKVRIEITKTDPDGESWPERGYGSHPLLVETGKLLRSIRKRRKSAKSYSVGTDLFYAKKHQQGLKVRRRRFLGMSENDKREMSTLVETFVELKFR